MAFFFSLLFKGEISTCSNSTRILPQSLYLSHQFSFYTLGEDYHTLICRYQFDISGVMIEVRKAVEVSAYASSGGESVFVEGFSSPRDIVGGVAVLIIIAIILFQIVQCRNIHNVKKLSAWRPLCNNALAQNFFFFRLNSSIRNAKHAH